MEIIVFGASGQLGTELCAQLDTRQIKYVSFNQSDIDITDIDAVIKVTSKLQPTHIINCAAFTQVDKCESEQDLAYAVNAIGARNVAIASEKIGSKLIHISTDFVFDGTSSTPYFEFDFTNPLSVYGRTKLAGENLVKQFSKKHFIIRTSWLYGHHGANFVKTMLKLSETQDELSVVNDQVGSPTYVNDLVEGILLVLSTEKYGVYHYSNQGSCSWHEFAKKIFELTGRQIIVNGITSEMFDAPAVRPKYSVMEKYMYRQEFNYIPPLWEESLTVYLEKENLLIKR